MSAKNAGNVFFLVIFPFSLPFNRVVCFADAVHPTQRQFNGIAEKQKPNGYDICERSRQPVRLMAGELL